MQYATKGHMIAKSEGCLSSKLATSSAFSACFYSQSYSLALSYGRSGSSASLSGYMGKSDTFDRTIAAFSIAHADQNEKDDAALDHAVREGRVKALFEGESCK
ncbi:MAG: hypothetical protein CXZ00_16190 [Acidobacteria bacterium]|nr:MAG: hypothetical protein CXZ00_16190 [Acidobacteriota bacterium]